MNKIKNFKIKIAIFLSLTLISIGGVLAFSFAFIPSQISYSNVINEIYNNDYDSVLYSKLTYSSQSEYDSLFKKNHDYLISEHECMVWTINGQTETIKHDDYLEEHTPTVELGKIEISLVTQIKYKDGNVKPARTYLLKLISTFDTVKVGVQVIISSLAVLFFVFAFIAVISLKKTSK